MDFDKMLYDGGLKRLGHVKIVQRGVEIYTVRKYSDLDELFGPKWFIRGFNKNGDFCYAILDTIHFYLKSQRPLVEFKPASGGTELKKCVYSQGYYFFFVRGDGSHILIPVAHYCNNNNIIMIQCHISLTNPITIH